MQSRTRARTVVYGARYMYDLPESALWSAGEYITAAFVALIPIVDENEGQRCTARLFLCRRYPPRNEAPALAPALFRPRSLLAAVSLSLSLSLPRKLPVRRKIYQKGFNSLAGFRALCTRLLRVNNRCLPRYRHGERLNCDCRI